MGAFADMLPKGRVMFICNSIKIIGTFAMLSGVHPLMAYAIVGLGAAAYSPAKYGILTEYLPPQKLVLANGWMEGSTVMAIILGTVIGGTFVSPTISSWILETFGLVGKFSPAELAISIILVFYAIAAVFNLYIPKMNVDHQLPHKNPMFLIKDFMHCFKLLWIDSKGQITLAVTTLFWGAGATLKFVVLDWGQANLALSFTQSTQLTAVVAIGVAIGSIIAGKYVSLDNCFKVLPAGIAMGAIVMSLIFVNNLWIGILLLIAIGGLAGFFVVPINAMLQHRGHMLMGAGHSIAVQNFNENIGILVMVGVYTGMVKLDLGSSGTIIVFGLLVSTFMTVIMNYYRKQIKLGNI